jgi:hypothetical protein
MANNTEQSNPPTTTNNFVKGMSKDVNETYIGEGQWTHARNAVNNSHDGQVGVIGNEPSNIHCVSLPYTLIGAISLSEEKWALFTTDNTNSEIGIFDEALCTYDTLVNDDCLNFKTKHLITGVSRSTFDCTRNIYFADGNNPDRVLNINNIPYKKEKVLVGSCYVDQNIIPLQLDCEQLRLASLLDIPCVSLVKATGSGTLQSGTYQVAIAYALNEIKVTDYLVVTNPVSIWSHGGVAGALTLSVTDTDPDFDQMEVVVISNVNAQTVAKTLGIYSTRQSIINIDNLDPTLVTVPLSNVLLQTPSYEKSLSIFNVGSYLLRNAVYTKPDFNYQPQANRIISKWLAIQYPGDYYHKGGANVGYLRDEVYSYFIRWIYNTGDRSASYHIPGRPYGYAGINDSTWTTKNTGTITGSPMTTLPDGGIVVKEGYMGFWESEERYPDNNAIVWNQPTGSGTGAFDLCGKKIRHHKFPNNNLITHFSADFINVMGVKFENITHPLDNNGNPINSIVGYEILRGSREGNKSIVAKGIINNIKSYNSTNSGGEVLFQNYPYNDVNNTDPFIDVPGGGISVKNDYVSFHSPDTTFQRPYFGSASLVTYGDMKGTMKGHFETPFRHPEFKILGRTSDTIARIITGLLTLSAALSTVGAGGQITLESTEDLPISSSLVGPLTIPDLTVFGLGNAAGAFIYAGGILAQALQVAALFGSGLMLSSYRQKILDIITGFISSKQYASQFNSVGVFTNYELSPNTFASTQITPIKDYGYVKSGVQSFRSKQVNNLFRNDYVIINTTSAVDYPFVIDNSLDANILNNTDPNAVTVLKSISSKYAAIKVNLPTQYGQIESIRQIPIVSCVYKTLPTTTGINYSTGTTPIFGGDTYINLYTEKNQFTFFNDWLIDQPKDYTYNYKDYQNIEGVRYWVDNRKAYEGFFSSLKNYYSLNQSGTRIGKGADAGTGWLVDPGYFYLSCNGTRVFYTESEVNVGYRDYEDTISKQFYDPYGNADTTALYRSDVIKSPSFYKYDYSLSVSRLYNQFVSWGSVLPKSFNPLIAESCYSFYPKRVIYSLPQSQEFKRDNWRTFLILNYKDFPTNVTSIKNIGKNGAVIYLEKASPLMFMGVDSLQTELGTKITIGDGGLFSQPQQAINNSDASYQYGACESNLAIVSTANGVYHISQEQGKIFNFDGSGLEEISNSGMKWWFSRYLPSKLLSVFPNYADKNNPVDGIGTLSVYDNINQIVYFSKKDYEVVGEGVNYDEATGFWRDGGTITRTFPGYTYLNCEPGWALQYILGTGWVCTREGFNNRTPITVVVGSRTRVYEVKIPISLCNTAYFKDCSWTVSYDIKSKSWLSFHDWHPNYIIPSKTHFITSYKPCNSSESDLWRHNTSFNSFCNFYGVNYPFEIEYVSATGQQVATMHNVEYLLEAYNYSTNGQDKFHVLDFNFDRSIIYNSEQISGLLKLNLKSKSNPFADLTYPSPDINGINILFSKEEQKYRFNQFWDITLDRGEYSGNQYKLMTTDSNGYEFYVNPLSVDNFKSPTERKKFRHNVNKVLLRKNISGSTKMNFKIINTKLQQSQR